MSWLGDIFGGDANKAAQQQQQGLLAGMNGAMAYLFPNKGIIENYSDMAAQPFNQNYYTGAGGTQQYGNLLAGLLGQGGPTGTASALEALKATPGYQFTKNEGESAINAAAAANGTLNSGNQLKALSDYDAGLASKTYEQAVGNAQSALNPYMNLSNASASGLGGIRANEISGLTGNNNILAQLVQGTYTGMGNAQAKADIAKMGAGQSLLGGALQLGSSLLGGMGGLGGIAGSIGGALGGAAGGSMIGDAALGDSFMGGSFFG